MEISITKRDETTLAVKFNKFGKGDIEKLKNVSGRKWVPEEAVWTLPYTLEKVEQLLQLFRHSIIHVDAELQEECYLLQERLSLQEQTSSSSPSPVYLASQWGPGIRNKD